MATPDRNPIDWLRVRAEYEAGESYAALAGRYGCTRQAMSKRGRKDGWQQDAVAAVQRQVAEQLVVGRVAVVNHTERREAAIEAAVDIRVSVIKRHRDELQAVRALIYDGMNLLRSDAAEKRTLAASKLKDARLAAHALAIVQDRERRAYGIPDKEPPGPEDNTVRFVWVD
jgi:hypothetical protein